MGFPKIKNVYFLAAIATVGGMLYAFLLSVWQTFR
jgi:hypothetical protein